MTQFIVMKMTLLQRHRHWAWGIKQFCGSKSLRESAVATKQARADNLLDTHRLYYLYFDFMNHSRTPLRSQHR